MKLPRLPKPIGTNVTHKKCYIGSVYTAEQMKEYAKKAVIEEREACAKVCDDMRPSEAKYDMRFNAACTLNADTIRARGK